MASRTNLGPSIRTRPCASDPPSRDAARSSFNRELEAELISMSRDDRLVQIADGEFPYTPSGRALTLSSQL